MRAKSRVRCRESSTGRADAPYCEAILSFPIEFFFLLLLLFLVGLSRAKHDDDDGGQLQRFSLLEISALPSALIWTVQRKNRRADDDKVAQSF